MNGGRRGFTLLELLVAAALVAGASVIVVGAFAAGLRVHERARHLGGFGEAVVVMELLQKDLRNAVPFRLAGLQGNGAWIQIPGVVRGPQAIGGGACLGTVRYEQGKEGHGLDRVVSVYVSPDRIEQTRERLLESLDAVVFSYAAAGSSGNAAQPAWTGTWSDPTNLPAAVMVVLSGREGGAAFECSRRVVLPRH